MFSIGLYRRRRKQFMDAMGEGIAVFPAAPVRLRSNDVDHRYRPDSDLYYLTGCDEPEVVLILKPGAPEGPAILVVRPKDAEKEVFSGSRIGPEKAVDAFGVDRAVSTEGLGAELLRLLTNVERIYFRLGCHAELERLIVETVWRLLRMNRSGVEAPHTVVDPRTILSEMRMIKSPEEISTLRRAADLSVEGHRAAMRALRPGLYEYELESILEHAFRSRGALGPGFNTMVGSGRNACTLHYCRNDRRMESGDLVLVDAGAECDYLCADISRAYPVSGRFSPAQATIYTLVLDAYERAVSRIVPGAIFQDVHDVAVRTLTQGLVDLGFVEGPLDTALEKESYKPFYMHRTSHWLGMDVHDVGRYRLKGQWRVFVPGQVLTVEPGLYIGEGQPGVPKEFWNIGIRIEDDVLVTPDGREVLTGDLPRTVSEIEHEIAAGGAD